MLQRARLQTITDTSKKKKWTVLQQTLKLQTKNRDRMKIENFD